MKQKWMVLTAAIGMLFVTAASSTTKRGGAELFEKRCTGCHALDSIKAGPPLRSVYLRRSASDPKFPYSDALKNAQLNWDAATLDRWLLNPDDLAPGTDMSFRLDRAEERAAIIAYLKQISDR